ncbi:amidohydrolase [Alkalicoccobacillus porphyridii]|uniref:Amidohydrolase n=1 Tax=Alkalicoccobacillus porphyridii TaxID=2597270 RepID=A0A554A1A8_9BACI|nr:amidohydrolase [Alkalicoccobacillus porphyridii]TSB47478.1 amidohydrolase [Alkalicoccobacillus porphyridii]
MTTISVEKWVNNHRDLLKSWRQTRHQLPEVGWTEIIATYTITQHLKNLHGRVIYGKELIDTNSRQGMVSEVEWQEAATRAEEHGVPASFIEELDTGHTGALIQFDTGSPGPHVAYRFDIDALPIKESDDASHEPRKQDFPSQIPGAMHACAHDGHAAIGLGVASFISEHLNQLTGTITVIFQPAEEGSRGAKAIVNKGWLDRVDYFISGHIGISSLSVGEIASTTHSFLATTKFNVSFQGVSSHAGAKPEEGRNALLAAATAATQLHAVSRHSGGASRINVGSLHAGSGRNIIADTAELQGETRGSTTEINEFMIKEAKRIIQAAALMYDVEAHIEIVGQGEAADCDEEWKQWIPASLQGSELITNVLPTMAVGASEDVTVMMNRVQQNGGKATYMIFGTPLAAGHHHPAFDYDENVLAIAVTACLHPLVTQIWSK